MLLIVSLSALSFTGGLMAATIYQWIDEKGEVHFSDALPEGSAENIRVLEVGMVPYATTSGASHYYSVFNQARRLEQQRLEREKLLAEKRKLQAERRWLEEQQPADPSREVSSPPVYALPAPGFRSFHPRRPARARHRYPTDHPAYGEFRPGHRPPSAPASRGTGQAQFWHWSN
jgi:hypothetical protein